MEKYTDDDIRKMDKITCKIAADYLGISPNLLTIGMRNDKLPIGFAVRQEDRYREIVIEKTGLMQLFLND